MDSSPASASTRAAATRHAHRLTLGQHRWRLATATFTNETATGWQQANFASPVAVTAGTTYVASYLAPNGHYASDTATSPLRVTDPPLTALGTAWTAATGSTATAAAAASPPARSSRPTTGSIVVFSPGRRQHRADGHRPAAGFRGDRRTCHHNRLSHLQRAVQQSTITMTLSAGSSVAASTSSDAASRSVTLTPNANLAASTCTP